MLDRFVTFEGGEGAGKSTQTTLMARTLQARGCRVVVTREPGGSPLAERVRSFLLSTSRPALDPSDEALLFAVARSDHLAKVIRPALASGAFVLCDRFSDSTMAYQGPFVPGPLLEDLYVESVGDDGPCLTFVLDVPPSVGLLRAGLRRGRTEADRFEAEGSAFHERLRETYLAMAARDPERMVVVDATLGPAALASALMEVMERRLDVPRVPSGVRP